MLRNQSSLFLELLLPSKLVFNFPPHLLQRFPSVSEALIIPGPGLSFLVDVRLTATGQVPSPSESSGFPLPVGRSKLKLDHAWWKAPGIGWDA